MSFPTWLLEKLNERGWSQAELARRAGSSRASISDVLSEKRNVGTDLAIGIAKAFDIPEEEVFRAAGLLKPKKGSDRAERLLYQIEQLDEQDQETIETFVGALLEKRNKKNTLTKSATS